MRLSGTVFPVTSPARLPDRLGLARKYRPSRFAELTGQRHVSAVLRRAVLNASVPQQLLLSGGSGLGKTTVARICAAAILCETPLPERPDGDACGRCEACLDISTPGRTHPDVIEFDAASNGGKDEIREIAARAALTPMRGRFKVYVIDEAHGLSGPGGQAFLKLLEEPPPHVVFMLATTDPQKMLKTNRGRCTEFELLRPTDGEIVANLQRVASGEGWTLSDRVAHAVLAATSPDLGVRGTLMTLEKLAGPLSRGEDPDDELLSELLGVAPTAQVSVLTERILAGDRGGALDALALLRSRVSDSAVRAALLEWARAVFVAAVGGGPGVDSSPEMALHRYETLAAAPQGEVWTECTVARLAAPYLVPSAESLAAQLAEAQRLVASLHERTERAEAAASAAADVAGRMEAATKDATLVGKRLVEVTRDARSAAPATAQPAGPAPAPASPPAQQRPAPRPAPEAAPGGARTGPSQPAPSQPAPSQQGPAPRSGRPSQPQQGPSRPGPAPRADRPAQPAPPQAPPSRPAPAEPARRTLRPPADAPRPPASQPDLTGGDLSAEAEEFLQSLAARSNRTAAMVRSCRLVLTASGVRIDAPPAIAVKLSDPAVVSDLRAAAGALGLPVRVVES